MTLDSTNDFYTELNLNPTKLICDAICDGAMWDKDIDEYVDSCNAGLWEDNDHDLDGDDYDSYDYYYDDDHDSTTIMQDGERRERMESNFGQPKCLDWGKQLGMLGVGMTWELDIQGHSFVLLILEVKFFKIK